MTDGNAATVVFAGLGRRQVVADFRGGTLTRDAGALLLREADRRLGLLDALNRAIPDPRHPFSTMHQQRHMLAQRQDLIVRLQQSLSAQRTEEKTQRREWFTALHDLNARLHARHPEILAALDAQIRQAQQQFQQEKTLHWREYFYALHTIDSLRQLIAKTRAM